MEKIKFPNTTSKERSFLCSIERQCKVDGVEFKWEVELQKFRENPNYNKKIVEDIFHVDKYGNLLKNDGSKHKPGKVNRGVPFTKYKNVKGAFGSQNPSYNKNPRVIAEKKKKKLKLWDNISKILEETFGKE